MYIVDKELEKRENEGKPIRIGLIGAGFAARAFALQVLTAAKGMRLVAIANRTVANAEHAYLDSLGADTPVTNVKTADEFGKAYHASAHIVTTDPILLTDSPFIDVIVEATGEVEFPAPLVLRAIEHKKHIVLINAELNGTIGSLLKVRADANGVVYTEIDGDQQGKLMNIIREVKGMGFRPVLAGNVKSLIDFRRTPKTQEKWSAEHFQEPKMPTSFADGTKIAYEMAAVGNATGFGVGTRNMYGPRCPTIEEAHKHFNANELMKRPIVDYILGGEPSFGVFVLAATDHPIRKRYMSVYKMGDGPLYTFYVPHHLGPLEALSSVARAAILGDATLTPIGAPVCEVIATAKFDLKKGAKLDGIGGYTVYGQIENYDTARRENLLPMGLTDGCVLTRDLKQDEVITYRDIIEPDGSIAFQLRREQDAMFPIK